MEHAQYPINRIFGGKFVYVSNNLRFFVFFNCKYFALLLAICHIKGVTHEKTTRVKSDFFIWTDDEVELLLKVCVEYKTSKTNENTD